MNSGRRCDGDEFNPFLLRFLSDFVQVQILPFLLEKTNSRLELRGVAFPRSDDQITSKLLFPYQVKPAALSEKGIPSNHCSPLFHHWLTRWFLKITIARSFLFGVDWICYC